jgi:L-aspartate oxidase
MLAPLTDPKVPKVPEVPMVPKVRFSRFSGLPDESHVRGLMWNSVGLWREAALLQTAVEALDEWYGAIGEDRSRVAALITVGRLMARAALRREETRGCHARADFPEKDDVKFRIHLSDRIDS